MSEDTLHHIIRWNVEKCRIFILPVWLKIAAASTPLKFLRLSVY